MRRASGILRACPSRALFLLVLALLWIPAGAAHAQEFRALLLSDAGDYIGAGGRYELNSSAGTVTSSVAGGVVEFVWQGTGATWLFRFRGPDGAPLQNGTYANAVGIGSVNPGEPALTIAGLGRGCAEHGSFLVRDVAYDANGSLVRIAVDAIQRCDSSPRELHAFLRYGPTTVPLQVAVTQAAAGPDQLVQPGASVALAGGASISADGAALTYRWRQVRGPAVSLSNTVSPTPQFAAPAVVAEAAVLDFELEVTDGAGNHSVDRVKVVVSEIAQPQTAFLLESSGSETLTQGNGASAVPANPAALTFGRDSRGGISLEYGFGLPTISSFRAGFAGPGLSDLDVGTYDLAYANTDPRRTGKPDVTLTGAYTCSQAVSWFVVHDIGYGARGEVLRLALDFVFICLETGFDFPVRGYIRINSTIPVKSRAPVAMAGMDLEVQHAQQVELDGRGSYSSLSSVTSYAWSQVSGPTVVLTGADTATPTFTAPVVAAGGADLVFEISVGNATGLVSRDQVKIHVLGDSEGRYFAYVRSANGDFVTGGADLDFDRNYGGFQLRTEHNFGREIIRLDYQELTWWNFVVQSPAGKLLQPGVYARTDFRSDDLASFSLSGDGRGCNANSGTLIIHEIERDLSGNVVRIAFDFENWCDFNGPVIGVVRYNSRIPIVAASFFASAGPAQSASGGDRLLLSAEHSYLGGTTQPSYAWRQVSGPAASIVSTGEQALVGVPDQGGVLVFELTVTAGGRSDTSTVTVTSTPRGTPRSLVTFDADAGELVTQGFSRPMAYDDFPIVRVSTPDELHVQMLGAHAVELRFWAPEGRSLATGEVFEGARYLEADDIHRAKSLPAMYFDYDGARCANSRGRFVIRQLVRGAGNQITSLAVDFQSACAEFPEYVRGALRINSDVPVDYRTAMASAGRDQTLRDGIEYVLDGGASWGGPVATTSYRWEQVSGPTVQVLEPSSARTRVRASAASGMTADAVLRLTVSTSQGETATDTVALKILGPAVPATEGLVAFYGTNGTTNLLGRYDPNSSHLAVELANTDFQRVLFYGNPTMGHGWNIDLSTGTIAPGVYRIPGVTSFRVWEGYGTCPDQTGVVDIREARYVNGRLDSAAFNYDIRCAGKGGWAGAVRVNNAQAIAKGEAHANAGPDLTVDEGSTVVLDGLRSYFVATPVRQYQWRQVTGPTISLQQTATGVVQFVAPQVSATTTLQFAIDVDAEGGASSGSDTMAVTVQDVATTPPPSPTPTPTPTPSPNPGGSGGSSGGGGALGPGILILLMLQWIRAYRRYPRLLSRSQG